MGKRLVYTQIRPCSIHGSITKIWVISNMKYYTVYETVNKETGRCYRGKHITDNPYDGYLGSGKYLKHAIKKHGIECFEKFVLYVFDNKEDMAKKEAELVTEEYLRSGNTYNLKLGGDGGWDYLNKNTEKNIENKRRASVIGNQRKIYLLLNDYKFKKEYSKRSSDTLKKTHREGKIKIPSFSGNYHTEETKKTMSEKHTGKHIGEKNSQYGKCWIVSDIEKKSISIKKDDLQIWLDKGWIKGRRSNYDFV